MTMNRAKMISSCMLALALSACDGSASGGDGSLMVVASGEEAAEVGFPVGQGEDAIAFADGWTLAFSKVLVSVADFRLRSADGDEAAIEADPVVFDLHQGTPELWSFEGVPAQRWERVSFAYRLPSAKSRAVGDVADADVARMSDAGYSLLVAGAASKDDRDVEFEFGFPFEVTLDRCHSGFDDSDGLVIADGAVAEAQLTIHLDHLFFDDYASEAPALRFDAMAAMAPPDGPLTLDDLAAQDNLSDLVDVAGSPLELAYDPGPEFAPVPENLREFVVAAATTTGHFNGEGHCDYERVK